MELMEIEKFINHNLGKWFVSNNKDDRRLLRGSFKQVGSDKIIENDEFLAYEIQKGSALDTYKCYIKYFNYTLRPLEKERIPIKAIWVKKKEEEIDYGII